MEIHDLIAVFQIVITALAAIAASSGFWVYIDRKRNNSALNHKLLLGLAHDRITYLGMKYLQRGWITRDEYENLCVFLYEPYSKMGGNGTVEKIMAEIRNLTIVDRDIKEMKGNIRDVAE